MRFWMGCLWSVVECFYSASNGIRDPKWCCLRNVNNHTSESRHSGLKYGYAVLLSALQPLCITQSNKNDLLLAVSPGAGRLSSSLQDEMTAQTCNRLINCSYCFGTTRNKLKLKWSNWCFFSTAGSKFSALPSQQPTCCISPVVVAGRGKSVHACKHFPGIFRL